MLIAGAKAHNNTALEITYDMRSRKDLLSATFYKDAADGGLLPKNWVDIEIPPSSDTAGRERLVLAFALALGVPLSPAAIAQV